MELTDYDILGVNPKATFRQVKHAYHDLARLYHPDSAGISKKINKKEREYAIKKINRAYENIKRKLNVVEVDLPQEDKKYEPLNIDFENLKLNENENENEKMKKFHKKFEEYHRKITRDDPFSIYYKEPEESKKTKHSTKIIETFDTKKQKLNKKSKNSNDNEYEFGINFVNDHSGNNYLDIRNLHNEINENENEYEYKSKYENDNISILYEKMIEERNKEIVLSISESEFIKKQDELKKEIEKSKKSIYKESMKNLIT